MRFFQLYLYTSHTFSRKISRICSSSFDHMLHYLQPMMRAKTFAGNFLVQVLGKIGSLLIGLIVIALLTRYLSTSDFGAYTTAVTYLQFFGVIVDFGLTLTLIVMISEPNAEEEKITGNFFTMRLVSGGFLFALAAILVFLFPWSATIQQAVVIGAVAYWIMGGASLLTGLFQKHACMWRPALAELVNRTVLVGVVLLFAWLHLGVVSMMTALILSNLIWLAVIIFFAKPLVRVRPRFDLSLWKQAIGRSWPIAVSILFNLLYLKGDILLLSLLRTQEEVAYYGVTYRILDILTALPTMFMGLLLPTMVAAWSQKRREDFVKTLRRSFDVFMMAVLPIVVGAQVIATRLMIFIAGNEYAFSGDILRLLILAVLGVFVGTLYGHLVVALQKQKLMMWGYGSVALLSIISYLWLIPPYGVWGAVWVTIFSEFAIALLTFGVVTVQTKSFPKLLPSFKALLASLVMYVFLMRFPSFHVLTDIALGALVYLAALIALKGVRVSDIKQLLPSRFLPLKR